ncbi:hypothetical protein [Viscerimonas tarda]
MIQVQVTFGNKTVYFDPLNGKSPSSNTIEGVIELLSAREDIADKETVIEDFKKQAAVLIQQMKTGGYSNTQIG